MRTDEPTQAARTANATVAHRLRPFLLIACLAQAVPGHAYLDPGTGSIILQSILAGIAVAMGVIRLYWQRLKDFLGSLSGSTRHPDDADDSPPDQGPAAR